MSVGAPLLLAVSYAICYIRRWRIFRLLDDLRSGWGSAGHGGILGPTRMKYAEAVALVPALAGRLQESLESL